MREAADPIEFLLPVLEAYRIDDALTTGKLQGRLDHCSLGAVDDQRRRNVGDQTLMVTKVKGSCGCTVIKTYDRKIAPGKEGKLPFKLNTRGMQGAVRKSVTIWTNDPTDEQTGCDGCPLYYTGGALEVDYSGLIAQFSFRLHF